jgi:hypothetical protein
MVREFGPGDMPANICARMKKRHFSGARSLSSGSLDTESNPALHDGGAFQAFPKLARVLVMIDDNGDSFSPSSVTILLGGRNCALGTAVTVNHKSARL